MKYPIHETLSVVREATEPGKPGPTSSPSLVLRVRAYRDESALPNIERDAVAATTWLECSWKCFPRHGVCISGWTP